MLNFYNCIRLLDEATKCGLIQRDPNISDNILVYREAGEEDPEGWYSENLMYIAQELQDDEEGQTQILGALEEKTGRPFEIRPLLFPEIQERKRTMINTNLAECIDQLMYDYDYYGYTDSFDTREEGVKAVKDGLCSEEGVQSVIAELQTVADSGDERYVQRAESLIAEIRRLIGKPEKAAKVALRENLLVTFGTRAAYMDSMGKISLPSGVDGEDEIAAAAVDVVDRFLSNTAWDTSFDEFIETALTERFGEEAPV